MKLLTYITLAIIMILPKVAVSGTYNDIGYITEVKMNVQGAVCNLMFSNQPGGRDNTGGQWYCNDIKGSNMLSIAQMAYMLGSKVRIQFEGNGGQYRPVYSIEIMND